MVPCSLLLVSHPIKIVDGLLISLLISLLFLRRFVHQKADIQEAALAQPPRHLRSLDSAT